MLKVLIVNVDLHSRYFIFQVAIGIVPWHRIIAGLVKNVRLTFALEILKAVR